MTHDLLTVRGIVRRFGTVLANDGIDLDVARGQIVGLLGENGSGKSTLMRILFGMIRPDAGSIVIDGRTLANHRPADAIAAGLAMIHQHFTLVEASSVLDNIMLGWPEAGRLLRRRDIAARIREASARFGLDIDPRAQVSDLPLGRRQRVEILKAILRGADLLILDEPTSNLAPAEVASLLDVLRNLRGAGTGIIFISHKLPEVLALCDDIVVLRAGRVALRLPAAGSSRQQMAEAMIGRTQAAAPAADRTQGAPRLTVTGLTLPGLYGIDLTVRAGEVLGIAGVDGNGQRELVEALAGMRPVRSGRIEIDGSDITRASVATRLRAGLAYMPADRAMTALVPGMTIEENLALRGKTTDPTALMREFDIRASGPRDIVAHLSGGNRQKIVIAREFARRPSVLVAHQPAWGLDPASTEFVLRRVASLAAAGSAILYVSSELEDVLVAADRIGVLFNGHLVGIADRGRATQAQLGQWMSGAA